MHLFIANGTHQVQHFYYRLPEVKQVRQQTIPIGGQIRISGDLNSLEIESIVKQYETYGMIPADEIEKGNKPAPFAYRVDKHITGLQIERLTQRNQGILVDRGKETRQNAAIVLANTLGNSAREGGTGVDLGEAEVEIVEEETKGGLRSGEKLMEERTVVTRENRQTRSGRESRRR